MRYLLEVFPNVPIFRAIGFDADVGNETGLRIKDFIPGSTETEVRNIFRHEHFRGMIIRIYTGRDTYLGARVLCDDTMCMRSRLSSVLGV